MTRHSLACTCSNVCRRRHARYEKVRDHAARTGRPFLVPALGATRRLQALMAAGWTLQQVADAGGLPYDTVRGIMRCRPEQLTRKVAMGVAAAYTHLTELPEPVSPYATRNRNRAHRLGWQPPEAWLDDELDDPEAVPYTGVEPLEDAWEALLAGEPVPGLHWSLRVQLADRWQASGRSLAALERAGWQPHRDRRLASGRAA